MAYEQFKRPVTAEQREKVGGLVRVLANMEAAEATKAQELKEAASCTREVAEKWIPEALAAAGVTEMTLDDVTRVRLREDVVVSPKKEDRAKVIAWLEATGHGNLCTDDITVTLPKGDERLALLRALLSEEGFEFDHERTVHPQTLKAHVRRLLEAGKDVPMALLNAYWLREAVVMREEKVFEGE